MSLILHLETAASVCSVALANEGKLIAIRESDEKNAHSKVITRFIEEVMRETGNDLSDLDAVAVSEGPGSYTGLRIGVATAKGLCYSLDRPMIAVPTLQSMAAGMVVGSKDKLFRLPVFYVPMLDARRMEVYDAVFDANGKLVRETRAEIIDDRSFAEFLKDHQLVFAGDGAEKCKSIFGGHPDVFFAEDFRITASSMIPLALQKFQTKAFEDVAYFEPAYLKDFIAAKPRVKGLR